MTACLMKRMAARGLATMTDSEFLEYLTAETQAMEDPSKRFIVAELKAKLVFWQAQCELREKRLREVEAELERRKGPCGSRSGVSCRVLLLQMYRPPRPHRGGVVERLT